MLVETIAVLSLLACEGSENTKCIEKFTQCMNVGTTVCGADMDSAFEFCSENIFPDNFVKSEVIVDSVECMIRNIEV